MYTDPSVKDGLFRKAAGTFDSDPRTLDEQFGFCATKLGLENMY